MEDAIHLIKTAGPKMVPFIKAVTIYFMLEAFDTNGETWTTILKCAPIICLIFFILLYGFKLTKEYTYSQKILMGLVFSCVGDALLNVNLFPHGMGAFAVAQIFYISAFGLYPVKLIIGIILYSLGILFVSLIFHSLDDILIIGLPIYAFLLTTMCWRAIARAVHQPNIVNILCSIGSILFVFSDACIAIDRFYSTIPNARIYIMTTYYAAQFAITLSIVKARKSEINNPSLKETKTTITTFQNVETISIGSHCNQNENSDNKNLNKPNRIIKSRKSE